MKLDEAHKQKVSEWLEAGLKLADIQKRLSSELGVTLTYMEVRLVVDDLRLTPKDPEPPQTPEAPRKDLLAGTEPEASAPTAPSLAPESPSEPTRGGGVSGTVAPLARPGTVASGSLPFSAGNVAEWYLDQMGRLGLLPKQTGYRPSQPDVLAFQTELQRELGRLGL